MDNDNAGGRKVAESSMANGVDGEIIVSASSTDNVQIELVDADTNEYLLTTDTGREVSIYLDKTENTLDEIKEAWSSVTQQGENRHEITYSSDGKQICGAKNNNQLPCKKSPTPGRNRCRFHGGKSLVGSAHPSFKDGRYSRFLPERLKERYDEIVQDEDLSDLRDELTLLRVRLSDLVENLEVEDSRERYRLLRERYDLMRQAVRSGEKEKFEEHTRKIGELINKGADDYRKWEEIQNTISSIRLAASEQSKHQTKNKQMMTYERAMSLAMSIVGIISSEAKDKISDDTERRNFLQGVNVRIRQIISRENA